MRTAGVCCWRFIRTVGRCFPGCFSVVLVSFFRCLAYVDAVPTYHLTRGALYQVASRFSGFVLDYSRHPFFGVCVLHECCLSLVQWGQLHGFLVMVEFLQLLLFLKLLSNPILVHVRIVHF